jgi:hypothetical protein
MSGLGWCMHPQRRVTHDLKIMVRRGELGCRDGWSRDLWAPVGEVKAAAPADAPMTGPVRPVTPEEMTLLVSSKHVTLEPTARSVPTSPVDVVVGETPAIQTTDDRATLLSHDPRAAIEAARKRHLANLQGGGPTDSVSEPSSNPTPDLYSTPYRSPYLASMPASGGYGESHSRPIQRTVQPRFGSEVAPVRPDEVPRDSSGLTSTHEDEEHFSTVPSLVDGFDLPRARDDGRPTLVAGEGFEGDFEIAPTRVRAKRTWPLNADEEHEALAASFGEVENVPEPAEPAQPIAFAPAADDDWGYAAEESSYYEDELAIEQPSKRRRWQPSLRFERSARERDENQSFDAWDDDYEVDQMNEPEQVEEDQLLPEPAFEWREPEERLEITVEASPTIPRMCRTCRDFRPADNGGRGWCTNKWAFSHRRMVDADELPCETSLGCWWLPHDEVWLAEANAAAHTEPTPLVDQWLERRVGITAVTGTRRR